MAATKPWAPVRASRFAPVQSAHSIPRSSPPRGVMRAIVSSSPVASATRDPQDDVSWPERSPQLALSTQRTSLVAAGESGRLHHQVIPLGHARGAAGRNPVVRDRILMVARHFEQMSTNSLETVTLG